MWDGAFSPMLKKSIGTVRFVPLLDMSARDWAWLDYHNTRLVAQDRIARMAVAGKLAGFFQVFIVAKAKSNKQEYFWPADDSMIEDFASADEVTVADDGSMQTVPSNGTRAGSPASFFGNEPETDNLGSQVKTLDGILSRIASLGLLMPMVVFVAVVALAIKERHDDTEAEKFNTLMNEYMRTGDEEYVVAAALIALRHLNGSRLEILLDDLAARQFADGNTDQQEERDAERIALQIWDDLNQNRQQIAAGRGLT